jgi:hypothetical protein
MVTKDAKALVIASIDGTTLSAVLQQAADKGVKVVAYDRLIRDSPNVDYYTTFDNFKVGVLQAESLLKGLGASGEAGSVQHRAVRRLAGRQQRLLLLRRRHVGAAAADRQGRSGRQVGQTGMEKVGTLRWDAAVAQARMDNILSANYSDGSRVDAVLAPYDGLSRGIISSLRGVGYGTADQPWPIISGQDAETRRSRRSSPASSIRPCSRTRASWPRSTAEARRRRPVGRSRRSTTPRPTTTASRSFRQPADAGFGRQVQLPEDRGRLRLHQGRRTEVSIPTSISRPGRGPERTDAARGAFFSRAAGCRFQVVDRAAAG